MTNNSVHEKYVKKGPKKKKRPKFKFSASADDKLIRPFHILKTDPTHSYSSNIMSVVC